MSQLTYNAKLTKTHFLTRSRAHTVHTTAPKTALVRIHDDIMQALDRRKGVIFVLLDLSATTSTTSRRCNNLNNVTETVKRVQATKRPVSNGKTITSFSMCLGNGTKLKLWQQEKSFVMVNWTNKVVEE